MSNEHKKGLTYDEVKAALKMVTNAPAFSDLQFVENNLLPENTLMISSKIMKILKEIFNEQLPITEVK